MSSNATAVMWPTTSPTSVPQYHWQVGMSSGQLGQQASTLPVKTVHLRKRSLR